VVTLCLFNKQIWIRGCSCWCFTHEHGLCKTVCLPSQRSSDPPGSSCTAENRIAILIQGTTTSAVRRVVNRETREGWSLLTVETGNGDSKSTNERGPSLVGLLGLWCHAGTRYFCPALTALVSPVQNIFSRRTLFHVIAQKAGQAVAQDRLPLTVCIWL
jgi:hypothetical protein